VLDVAFAPPLLGTEAFVLEHPGWGYVIRSVHPHDMFMYLIWLRVTIGVTFTTLCADAMYIASHSSDDVQLHGVGAPVSVSEDSSSISHVGSGAISAPSGENPIISVEGGLPANSKLRFSLEQPSERHQAQYHQDKPEQEQKVHTGHEITEL
jgi:hypothetical protein